MQLTGHLSELSWLDLLRFLEQTRTTGCLTLEMPAANARTYGKAKTLYFWFSQGSLMGAAERLNNRSLLGLIHRQSWLSYKTGERLANTLPEDIALGTYLKQQGALTAKQLHWLFKSQVLGPIQVASGLRQGSFVFETLETVPQMEMTGLYLPIYEIQNCISLKAA